MLAQSLRHRADIQDLVTTQNPDNGAVSENWTSILGSDEAQDLVPMSITPLSGRELIAAAATQSDISTRIVMRYRRDIKERMRIVHDGIAYNIRAIIPDPKLAMWLTVMCTSGVNDG